MKKSLTLISPGRNGDLLLTIPIARLFHNYGFNIIWPVCSNFKATLDYVNFSINIIDIGPLGRAFEAYQKSYREIKGDYIDLAIGWGNIDLDREWKVTEKSFDQWKYEKAAIPLSEKYDLKNCIRRNTKNENELCNYLNIDPYNDKYIIVHEHGSNKRYFNFNIPNYLKNYKKINIESISNFTIFDWLLLIENSKAIFCVDSCIANLVDLYNINYNITSYFHYWKEYYTPLQIKLLTPKLSKNWKFL